MGIEASPSAPPGRWNEAIVSLSFMSPIAVLAMTRVIDEEGHRIPVPPLGPHTACLNLLICSIPVAFCSSMSAITYHPNFPRMAKAMSEIAPLSASLVIASFVAILLPDGFQFLPYLFCAVLFYSAFLRACRTLLPWIRRTLCSTPKNPICGEGFTATAAATTSV